MDATRNIDMIGRLVNDNRKPNCTMKKVVIDNQPYLCLFALDDITPETEITYDYNAKNLSWRKKKNTGIWEQRWHF